MPVKYVLNIPATAGTAESTDMLSLMPTEPTADGWAAGADCEPAAPDAAAPALPAEPVGPVPELREPASLVWLLMFPAIITPITASAATPTPTKVSGLALDRATGVAATGGRTAPPAPY